MRELSDNNVGYTIDSDLNNDEIRIILNRILSDRKYLIEMGKKAYDFAVFKYDGNNNAYKFKKQLESVLKMN